MNDKKITIPLNFQLNDTNRRYMAGMPQEVAADIIQDFIDYWTIDGKKRSDRGWQQAFRQNPVVHRKIVNFKHNQNKPKQQASYPQRSIEQKANELGLQARPGESWDDFNRRIQRTRH